MPLTAEVGKVVRQYYYYYYYCVIICNCLIRRAVNIMSVVLKRHASKLINLEALYHQSLLHRSHAPYQAPPHWDTVELLLWDTPIQGTCPFKRHKIWSHNQDTSLFWVKGHFFCIPKARINFHSGDTLAFKG